jgi:hypothetical protein
MFRALAAVLLAAVVMSGNPLASTPAQAWHWYEGGQQAARCTASYYAAKNHEPHTPCFSRHTAGFSFARGATTPFYAGITDQYDNARRRSPYRHGYHGKHQQRRATHAMKISK